MNDILGKVLSDEESMQQIKELAELLKSETASGNGIDSSSASSSGGGFDFSSLAGLLGAAGGGQNASSDGIDFELLTTLMKALSSVNEDDKNRNLLLALKPHVSADKQKKIDKAVKLLKIYAAFTVLKDSGILKSFDKLL